MYLPTDLFKWQWASTSPGPVPGLCSEEQTENFFGILISTRLRAAVISLNSNLNDEDIDWKFLRNPRNWQKISSESESQRDYADGTSGRGSENQEGAPWISEGSHSLSHRCFILIFWLFAVFLTQILNFEKSQSVLGTPKQSCSAMQEFSWRPWLALHV